MEKLQIKGTVAVVTEVYQKGNFKKRSLILRTDGEYSQALEVEFVNAKEELLDLYNTSLYDAKIKVLDLENQGYYEILRKFLLKSSAGSTKIVLRNAELGLIDKDSALVKRTIEKLNITLLINLKFKAL